MALSFRRSSFWFASMTILCALFIIPSYSQSQPETASKRRLVERPSPVYPTLARAIALGGTVRVEAIVSPDGSVKTVDVKGGHPVLVQAAVSAVRKWRWEQASHESREPVEVRFSPE